MFVIISIPVCLHYITNHQFVKSTEIHHFSLLKDVENATIQVMQSSKDLEEKLKAERKKEEENDARRRAQV